MYTFKVGEPFPLPEMKEEKVVFSVEPYTVMLTYRFRHPTEEEIREFREGTCELAVTEMRQTLFVLSRFGRLRWSDAPYSTHLSESSKKLPDLTEDSRGYSVDAFLVDCSNNMLVAHRLVRMTRDFSFQFRDLLEKDLRKPFDPAEYDKAVAEVYQNYSTADLLRFRQIYMKEVRD